MAARQGPRRAICEEVSRPAHTGDAKLISVSGKLRQIKDKMLLLETEATTILRFRLLDKTRFQNENDDASGSRTFVPATGSRFAVGPTTRKRR